MSMYKSLKKSSSKHSIYIFILAQGSTGPINKSTVTLWKNQNYIPNEEDKKVESDYIENLKKQVYFMEMELKLMKEREKEIEKSGGFTQLFNDDRDPSQHILQLKQKYSNMRKNMENKLEELNNRKREIFGLNVSLKAKLETLQKLEKEMFKKCVNIEEKSNQKLMTLDNDLMTRTNERQELDANNRYKGHELALELQRNIQLEHEIQTGEKLEKMKQEEFENQMLMLENMIKEKNKAYEEVNNNINKLENQSTDEPYFKTELEKNKNYKKTIESIEREILETNTISEGLELTNEFINKKREAAITDRKKYIVLNDEVHHAIEAKTQLNETRIQKKVKENNSEEIQKLTAHLESVNLQVKELEGKIQNEIHKSKGFTTELIKLNIDIRHKEEEKTIVIESVDAKIKELGELQDKAEDLKKKSHELEEKAGKETTDNQLLRNRYKLLAEEFVSINSRYAYITQNYDFTTNLKKISMEDLKNLTQTNNLVNDSILNFANKIGSFKKQNLQSLLERDEL